MANLSYFQRVQIVGLRMAGSYVTKSAELYSMSRRSVPKVMIAFEGKKAQEENNNLRGLLEKITKVQLRKLLQSLITILRTQFPQNCSPGVALCRISRNGYNQKRIAEFVTRAAEEYTCEDIQKKHLIQTPFFHGGGLVMFLVSGDGFPSFKN